MEGQQQQGRPETTTYEEDDSFLSLQEQGFFMDAKPLVEVMDVGYTQVEEMASDDEDEEESLGSPSPCESPSELQEMTETEGMDSDILIVHASGSLESESQSRARGILQNMYRHSKLLMDIFKLPQKPSELEIRTLLESKYIVQLPASALAYLQAKRDNNVWFCQKCLEWGSQPGQKHCNTGPLGGFSNKFKKQRMAILKRWIVLSNLTPEEKADMERQCVEYDLQYILSFPEGLDDACTALVQQLNNKKMEPLEPKK